MISRLLFKSRQLRVFIPVLLGFLLGPESLLAQRNITVGGTVMDEAGEPLIGVSVKIAGQRRAVSTDISGKYTIQASPNATLEFAYLGYIKQEIKVESRSTLDVVLKSQMNKLEEVVVAGYGTIRKSDYTGASSAIKLDKTEENRAVNIAEALQGRVAGVEIVNNTGQPGSGITFNIRGMTSITGSNQPLIVIDDQPVESGFGATYAGSGLDGGAEIPPADPLASINPADIESIEILKDASSIAIYGSRGANGVVLITTKSGKRGNDKVSYTNRFDLNMLPKQLKMLDTRDYLHYRNEAALNDGKDSVYTRSNIDEILASSPNVNWQDEIYKKALSQDHQLSLSGRDEKSNYYITGNYADQQSFLLNASYKRYGLRANYTRNVSKKLTMSIRNYISLADRNFGQESNWTGILGSSAVMGALSFNPLRTAYADDGTIDEEYANNPLLVTTLVKDKTQIRTLTSNLNLDYKITKNLTYTARGGVNDIYSLRELYYPRGTFIGNSAPNGSATRADNSNFNALTEHLLTYKKVFVKRHSLNAMGGYSYQKWISKNSSNTTMNFASDAMQAFNLQAGASPGRMYTGIGERALQSVLGRVVYGYDSRYSLTMTGRYDGATRLAEGKKWSFFPSVGLGWNVSNEKFFKDHVKFINNLKIRGSYGVSGNENIAIGATQAKYAINYVVLGNDILPSYTSSDFANPNLKWETTEQYNLGLNLGLAKDRLTFDVDFFKKNTKDLLINLALPASSGYADYYTNVGHVVNKGVEIESSYQILSGKKFKWSAGANFTLLRNKVLDMGEAGVIYGRTFFAGGSVLLSQPVHVAKVGYPISSFWGFQTDGIYQNAAEVAAGPEATTAQPGDIKWRDINNDGQITDDDKTVIGNPSPDFSYGFNTNLSYKRFTLALTFFGSQGNELINLTRWVVGINNTTGNYNLLQSAYDGRWRGEGTSNVLPKATTNGVRINQRVPEWLVEDASFFRLQSVNLGYTFFIPALKSSSLRVFVSGTNLFTITDYSGYDPHVNAFGNLAINKGVDLGTMPQARTFSGGVVLTF